MPVEIIAAMRQVQIQRQHLGICQAGRRSNLKRDSQYVLSNGCALTTVVLSPKVISLKGILLT